MNGVAVTVFFSYSHEDENLRNKLAQHLSPLKRKGVIQEWHDRKILPGSEWADEIDQNLKTADIILLLISAAFVSSEYCWSVELERAMARHEAREACVIPVILRPVDWQDTPFGKLQALPKNAQAVTLWTNQDAAFTDVAQGIRKVVEEIVQKKGQRLKPRSSENAESVQAVEEISTIPVQTIKNAEDETQEDHLQSEKGVDYTKLRDLLKAGEWKAADYETYLRMLEVVGREKDDWIRDEELLNFPCKDLRTIDGLWVKYSKGRFGFSVQKQIYVECGGKLDGKYPGDKIWQLFGDRVGWRVNSDWIAYNDVAFGIEALRGHLPVCRWGGWGGFARFVGGSSLARRLVNCSDSPSVL